MSVLIGKKAPQFKAEAVINGHEIIEDFTLLKSMLSFSSTLQILPLSAPPSCWPFRSASLNLRNAMLQL